MTNQRHLPTRRAFGAFALAGILAACASAPVVQSQPQRGILQILADDSSFSRFTTAAERAGVAQALGGAGTYTVFAFTNSGWEELPGFLRESLMSDTERLRLAAVINNLIVDGRHTIASMGGQVQTYTTRNGSRLTVDPRQAGRITVESAGGGGLGAGVASVGLRSARLIRQDIEASNGVIHVLDSIIVP
ncbi:fasciclin domain-containing protein [Humitalea sp. 24SJ18S-53]|uniref:fasciclin domain-containing protein n=1 Tax=Humitalea sp. 24SJ18S-53 TaxID=3422307 RepID=UPI003D669FFB